MAKDVYHNLVKKALVKEGWKILKDPFKLEIDPTLTYDIDLAAEKLIAAKKKNEIIIVEIKSFINQSTAYDFHNALGQYLVYQTGLEVNKEVGDLFLAVPNDTFNTFFQKPFIQNVLRKFNVKVVTFDPATKKIISWIK